MKIDIRHDISPMRVADYLFRMLSKLGLISRMTDDKAYDKAVVSKMWSRPYD